MLYTDIYNTIFNYLNYRELILYWSVSKYFQSNKIIINHINENKIISYINTNS